MTAALCEARKHIGPGALAVCNRVAGHGGRHMMIDTKSSLMPVQHGWDEGAVKYCHAESPAGIACCRLADGHAGAHANLVFGVTLSDPAAEVVSQTWPADDDDDGKLADCFQMSDDGWVCSLLEGHAGDHVARDMDGELCCVWPNSEDEDGRGSEEPVSVQILRDLAAAGAAKPVCLYCGEMEHDDLTPHAYERVWVLLDDPMR